MFAGQASAYDNPKTGEVEKIRQELARTKIPVADYYNTYAYVKSDGDEGCIPEVPKLTELNGSWIRREQVLTRDGKGESANAKDKRRR